MVRQRTDGDVEWAGGATESLGKRKRGWPKGRKRDGSRGKMIRVEQDRSDPAPETNAGMFAVEKLVAHRIRDQSICYLVKWQGFADSENTWEEEKDLPHATCVAPYWKSLGVRKAAIEIGRGRAGLLAQRARGPIPRQGNNKPEPLESVANTNETAETASTDRRARKIPGTGRRPRSIWRRREWEKARKQLISHMGLNA